MKLLILSAVALTAKLAEAFPPGLIDRDLISSLLDPDGAKSLGQNAANALANATAPLLNPPFDANLQLIDVTGNHAWQAPGANDSRGPCPGLNALANHGYLPRNGNATVVDLISAATTVFGMSIDLATVLSAYGAAVDGYGLGWQIGGEPGTGIGGSHGNYETDNSAFRGDLYQYGSSDDLVVSQFQQFFDLQSHPETANYDIDVLAQFRASRFQESVEKNPYFYFGPFSGTLVSQAAFSFIFRFMANHTAEYPAGILDQETLKSFNAISGESESFVWTRGHERIPENWYRRAQTDPYTVFGLIDDASTFAKLEPRINGQGCNNGTVNSYIAIQPSTNITNYDASNLTNDLCYAFAIMETVASQAAGDVLELLVLPIQNALGCNTTATDESVAKACPGYAFYGGPTAPVAPGAIQH